MSRCTCDDEEEGRPKKRNEAAMDAVYARAKGGPSDKCVCGNTITYSFVDGTDNPYYQFGITHSALDHKMWSCDHCDICLKSSSYHIFPDCDKCGNKIRTFVKKYEGSGDCEWVCGFCGHTNPPYCRGHDSRICLRCDRAADDGVRIRVEMCDRCKWRTETKC
jgi:hypothetical protein